MPELPEVETVKRGLHRLIIELKISKVVSDNLRSFPNAKYDVEQFLINAKVTDVRRRAKVLMIDLSTGYTLIIHLKMTGQLVFIDKSTRFGAGHPNDSLIGNLPDKSTRVIFEFSNGSFLYFNDQRKFGWVRLIPTLEVPNIDFMRKVGPEPLEADFTSKEFTERFKRRARTSIKAALLDQTVIAGVGNIYADESLWGAKIHPSRLVNTITDVEFKDLYKQVRLIMNLAIEKGGSTI
ncbi:MAG: formamidopyrimidine-DNA glycosylase, partial [Patescibacteria group bacterium]|nr:formamidopyrimidine-DNA glycosylase [Patescibacteria group bacterium]